MGELKELLKAREVVWQEGSWGTPTMPRPVEVLLLQSQRRRWPTQNLWGHKVRSAQGVSEVEIIICKTKRLAETKLGEKEKSSQQTVILLRFITLIRTLLIQSWINALGSDLWRAGEKNPTTFLSFSLIQQMLSMFLDLRKSLKEILWIKKIFCLKMSKCLVFYRSHNHSLNSLPLFAIS